MSFGPDESSNAVEAHEIQSDRPEPTTDTADVCSAVDRVKTHATRNNDLSGVGAGIDKVADELGKLVEGHRAQVGELNLKLDKCMVQDTCAQANIDALRDDLKQARSEASNLQSTVSRYAISNTETYKHWREEVERSTRLLLERDKALMAQGGGFSDADRMELEHLRDVTSEQAKKVTRLNRDLEAAIRYKERLQTTRGKRSDHINAVTEAAKNLSASLDRLSVNCAADATEADK